VPSPAFDIAVLAGEGLRVHSFAPPAVQPGMLADPSGLRKELYYGGNGRIQGTVKEDLPLTDLPLRRRVILCVENTGLAIRETWSDAVTGAYSFEWVREDYRYFVAAFDHAHNYRAVIADNLTPEPMP